MNQPSGSGYKHVGWKYFQVMSFLKDCYASRPREGNVPIRKGNTLLFIFLLMLLLKRFIFL